MKKMKANIFCLLILLPLISIGQKPTLYIGATAHLGNGITIETSAVSVSNAKFDIVANLSNIRIDPNAFDTIIRLYGKHIYPGFILPNTTLGITEIGAVRATHDFKEVGNNNPNVRSLTAYNTDSKITNTIRTNGILLAQVTPRGNVFSGQSSIFYLNGDNWEDAVYKIDDGIHLNWPSSVMTSGWWGNPGKTKKNKKYNSKKTSIEKLLKKAKAYYEGDNAIIDLKMESMKGLFDNTKILYLHANYVRDIREGIKLITELGVKKCVLVGGEEALLASNILKKYNIPIILNRIHRLPNKQNSPIDEQFIQPRELQKLGILFCFSYEGSMEAMGSRNLPFTAGTAVAYGLNYEDAISGLSLNTAKILGIDKNLGSIEKGKEATFFISKGDALEIYKNEIESAFIKGEAISLDNHQKYLYQKYNKGE